MHWTRRFRRYCPLPSLRCGSGHTSQLSFNLLALLHDPLLLHIAVVVAGLPLMVLPRVAHEALDTSSLDDVHHHTLVGSQDFADRRHTLRESQCPVIGISAVVTSNSVDRIAAEMVIEDLAIQCTETGGHKRIGITRLQLRLLIERLLLPGRPIIPAFFCALYDIDRVEQALNESILGERISSIPEHVILVDMAAFDRREDLSASGSEVWDIVVESVCERLRNTTLVLCAASCTSTRRAGGTVSLSAVDTARVLFCATGRG